METCLARYYAVSTFYLRCTFDFISEQLKHLFLIANFVVLFSTPIIAADLSVVPSRNLQLSLDLDTDWFVTLAQAATPSDRALSPEDISNLRSKTGGAALTPLKPIDPSLKDEADALAVWRNAVDNSAAAAPLTISGPQIADNPSPPAVQGVSTTEIRFGMASPFSGAAKESGHSLMVGVKTAFEQVNDAGGIYGRQLKLVTIDDGYEPVRTIEAMKTLYDQFKVFGFLCNFGTATAEVAAPFALEHKMLFFGAFTGSTVLRHDPPDRYIFNFRAAYAEETAAVLHYLVMVKRLRPDQIAVFAQEDGFGDAGYDGVEKEVRRLYGGRATDVLRLGYKRNTVDVANAVAQVYARRNTLKAVIMVATYRGAAKFIEKTRDDFPTLIYTNVSGVGSTSLADELTLLGPKYAAGVIVTQIVPAVDSYSTAVLNYKSALSKYFTGEKPDYVSFEAYTSANLLIDGLKQAGPQIDTERLVDALESLHDVDMGLGTKLDFSLTEHQASHKIWATTLDGTGHFHPLDLE